MTYSGDPRVDAYIDPLPGWQQAICREVREIVHEADPEVEETIKRRVQPYFVLDGNVCALLAATPVADATFTHSAQEPEPAGCGVPPQDQAASSEILTRLVGILTLSV